MEGMRYFLLRPTFLLLRVLAFLPLLSSGNLTQAEGARHVVNRTIVDNGLLSVVVRPDLQVARIRWFSDGTPTARLGDSTGRVFTPYNLSLANYSTLILRLDMYNETTLRIRDLTRGDGGEYKADVHYSNGTEGEIKFYVYDPVPMPNLTIESQVNTSDVCNFSNPAEQKNASISYVCPKGPDEQSQMMLYIVLAIIGFLAVLLMISVFFWRRKKKMKRKNEGPVPAETHQGELARLEVQ